MKNAIVLVLLSLLSFTSAFAMPPHHHRTHVIKHHSTPHFQKHSANHYSHKSGNNSLKH